MLALWGESRSEHASTDDRVEDVERLVADSPAALLVAERDGEIIGALIAAWDGWRGSLYRLAVKVSCRRQGIGVALVRAGEDYRAPGPQSQLDPARPRPACSAARVRSGPS